MWAEEGAREYAHHDARTYRTFKPFCRPVLAKGTARGELRGGIIRSGREASGRRITGEWLTPMLSFHSPH